VRVAGNLRNAYRQAMSRIVGLACAAALAPSGACASDEMPSGLFDPQAPGARGTVALAAGLTTDGYTRVAIRMTPVGVEQERRVDLPLAAEWPLEFFVGGGLGGSQVSDWTVRAWLATDDGEPDPRLGAPYDEAAIDTHCAGGNCQVVSDVALELVR
jgi:hypothetical protein